MNYRWAFAVSQPASAARLAGDLQISPLLAQCLINRGLETPEIIGRFLEPRLKDLSDPFQLPNMAAAVERLCQARARGEKLAIFGDYDVDGVTSTAILMEFLGALGWKLDFYLPHRMDEGYGLSREAVQNCLKKTAASVLLAVDCGSTAAQIVSELQGDGLDVLVLDHHQIGVPVPPAKALVNPQLAAHGSGCTSELCSAGLAFKLAHALLKQGRREAWPGAENFDLRPLLDLVALGTIADLVALTGENRVFVAAGLERLNRTARPGLLALRRVAQIPRAIGVYEVAFQLAPRLNAAGRLENAECALRLLLAKTDEDAQLLAGQLDAQNRARRNIERSIAEEVIGAVRAKWTEETMVIVEGQLPWHVGVVGIVASKVQKEFHRPAIILGGDGEDWRGSGRSIDGFDLAAALLDCSDLLVRFGGHAMAAGLSIKPENIERFRQRLNAAARSRLAPHHLQRTLRIDAEVTLAELTFEQVSELARLEPTGQGNAQVHLAVRNVRSARPPQRVGKQQQHLSFWVTDGARTFNAIRWNGAAMQAPRDPFDLAVVPELKEFRGTRSIELKVLDWKESGK